MFVAAGAALTVGEELPPPVEVPVVPFTALATKLLRLQTERREPPPQSSVLSPLHDMEQSD